MGRSQTERQSVEKGIDTVNNIKIVFTTHGIGKMNSTASMKRAVGK